MILQLTPNTHPILHEQVKKCSYDLDRVELSKILYENMMHHNGVGLSANQIGINAVSYTHLTLPTSELV